MDRKIIPVCSPDRARAASPIDHWNRQNSSIDSVGQAGYVICATPRTGSYWLCDLLRSTGCLGRPHEYFNGLAMRRHGSPDYPLDLEGQIAAAMTYGSTPNGVFGAKLFADQFARGDPSIMARLGNPLLIFLEREDLLGQAISLTRAAKTKVFFATAEPPEDPVFDAALIRDYLELIVRWNAEWQVYFARRGINPLRFSYEQVVAAPQAAIDRIAVAFRVEQAAIISPDRLSLAIQRDATTEQWRELFLAAQPDALHSEILRGPRTITAQRRWRRLAACCACGPTDPFRTLRGANVRGTSQPQAPDSWCP